MVLAPGQAVSHSSGANKRPAAAAAHPGESPAKKQSKWTPQEDALNVKLRGSGLKWEEISQQLPGRSAISCRLRYQNYIERRAEWDEEKKNKLARLYARYAFNTALNHSSWSHAQKMLTSFGHLRLKENMWEKLAQEMGIPWRSAEAMHWLMGEQEMAQRANIPVFRLSSPSPSVGISQLATNSGASHMHAGAAASLFQTEPKGAASLLASETEGKQRRNSSGLNRRRADSSRPSALLQSQLPPGSRETSSAETASSATVLTGTIAASSLDPLPSHSSDAGSTPEENWRSNGSSRSAEAAL